MMLTKRKRRRWAFRFPQLGSNVQMGFITSLHQDPKDTYGRVLGAQGEQGDKEFGAKTGWNDSSIRADIWRSAMPWCARLYDTIIPRFGNKELVPLLCGNDSDSLVPRRLLIKIKPMHTEHRECQIIHFEIHQVAPALCRQKAPIYAVLISLVWTKEHY